MPKKFIVYHPEYLGKDGKEFDALDAQDAAECYGEYYDECDYTIIAGTPIVVSVENAEGVVKIFKVTGESVPQYWASEVSNASRKA